MKNKGKNIIVHRIGYKTIFSLIPLFLYTFFPLFAQQIGMFSHYFYKPMIYNPAFTGISDGTNMMLLHRTQWADFNGKPQLNLFTIDKNFRNKKIGLGLDIISDKKGINSRTGGNLFYSYRMHISEGAHLSLGVSFGIINQALDFSKAVVENAADLMILAGAQQKSTYDGNAGFAFVSKALEAGFSVPQIFANKMKYSDLFGSHASYSQARHYVGLLKYKIFISKDKEISVVPQGLVRYVANAPFQYDAGLSLIWTDKFWIGAMYKNGYAIGAHAGFCIHKQFSLGYSYDIITGDIGKYSGMSHEILLNFGFGKNKKIEPENKKPEPQPEPVVQAPPKIESKITEPKTVTPPPHAKVEIKPEFDYNVHYKARQDSLAREEQKKKSQKKQINKNSEAIASNANKTIYKNVWIATNNLLDFKDASSQSQTGFYVVVGSFYNKGYAMRFVQRLINEGFKTANWMYAESTRFNYVFIIRVNTKEEAFIHANNAKVAGYEDAWIQRLIESR